MREAEEQNNQSSIDPTTGQFIPPPLHPPNPPVNGGGDQKMVIFNIQPYKMQLLEGKDLRRIQMLSREKC